MTLLTLLTIPSQLAESAQYQLNDVLAVFRTRLAYAEGDTEARTKAARDAMLQLVAVAEVFAGEHVVDLVEQRLPNEDLVLRLWDDRLPRVVRDWEGRKAAWNKLFEIQWTYQQWNEVDGFILARNVIAHGLGKLTRSHMRRGMVEPQVIQRLAAAGLALAGRELIVQETDVERCAQRVANFVNWLDDRARQTALAQP